MPSGPGSPDLLCLCPHPGEPEEKQVVGFLSAPAGLRELAVSTFHLDSVEHESHEELLALTFSLSALEAVLETTILEV